MAQVIAQLLHENITLLVAENTELENKIIHLEAENNQLRTTLCQVSKNNDDFLIEFSKLENGIERLRFSNEALTAENKSLQSEIENLRIEYRTFNK